MAEAKKAAFRAVARDEIAVLADVLRSPTEEWSKWTNQAGQTLLAVCKERGSFNSYALLAKALGISLISADVGKLSKAERIAQAFHAAAQDDMTALAVVLGGLSAQIWLRWRNKAGKDLLTMSLERKKLGAHAVLRKALASPLPIAKAPGANDSPKKGPSRLLAAGFSDEAAQGEVEQVSPKLEVVQEIAATPAPNITTESQAEEELAAPAKVEQPPQELAAPAKVEQPPEPVEVAQPPQTVEAPQPAQAIEAEPSPQAVESPPPAAKTEEPAPPVQAEQPTLAQPSVADEARKKSAEEARKRAEERKAREKEQEEKKAREKAELDARLARQAKKVEEEEALKASEQAKLSEEARKKEEEAASRKVAEEAEKKAQEEARRVAEEAEAKKIAEQEAQKAAEAEAKRKLEADAKKAEEEARRKAEDDAKKKADEEARQKAEDDAKKMAEAEAKRKAEEKKAEEEARKKAEEEAKKKAAEEAKSRPPPTIEGALKKKGKGGMFRRAWDDRYVVVQANTFSWYKTKAEVGKATAQGSVNLQATSCEAVADPSSATCLILRPKDGNWVGQNFKGSDEGREFVFDAAGSENSRESWLKALTLHCEFAQRQR